MAAEALHTALEQLRATLRSERDRLRPDTQATAWRLVETAAQLLPTWDRVSTVRGAEAIELVEVFQRTLPRTLEAFLAIPDAQKPAHADELGRQLTVLEERCRRLGRRLSRVLTSTLEAQGELIFGDGEPRI